ncbi:MAG: hypothetical protein AAGG48_25170 [Planctomycetota bacterium]
MRDSSTEYTDRNGDLSDPGERILETVESNALVLQDLLQQMSEVRDVMAAQLQPVVVSDAEHLATDSEVAASNDEVNEELRGRILELEDLVHDLEQQNNDLASQVATETVQQTVSSEAADALTWEERKQLILQQMEQDSFSAEQFVSSLQQEKQQLAEEDPSSLLDELRSEMEQHAEELARRDDEIQELRHLLEQQGGTRDGGIAIGAAAIAQAMDSDELIQQERERLQELQQQWEEKFRKGEIEMSLERAQLSRERQELATRTEELELQLEQLKRDEKYADENGAQPSRKWLAKLGLSDG